MAMVDPAMMAKITCDGLPLPSPFPKMNGLCRRVMDRSYHFEFIQALLTEEVAR